jgi:hypothetical protein
MKKQYKKFIAEMLRKRLFKFVMDGKQIRIQYNGTILNKTDLDFLFDVHRKNKAGF